MDDGRISVDNSQQKGQPGSFQPRHHITGYAWPRDPDADDGHLKVKLAGMPFAGGYDVLKTDYTSHAVIYSCFDVKLFKYENAWLLTREETPDLEPLVEIARAEYAKVKVDFDKTFDFTIQGEDKGCDYSH